MCVLYDPIFCQTLPYIGQVFSAYVHKHLFLYDCICIGKIYSKLLTCVLWKRRMGEVSKNREINIVGELNFSMHNVILYTLFENLLK